MKVLFGLIRSFTAIMHSCDLKGSTCQSSLGPSFDCISIEVTPKPKVSSLASKSAVLEPGRNIRMGFYEDDRIPFDRSLG